MTNADQKRSYVCDLYPGSNWKKKVERMPDDQITAIYLKHQDDGQPPESYSDHDEAESLEFEPEAQPLVEPPRVLRGPHANEDDFPSY